MKRLFRLTGRPGDVERDVGDEIRFHLDMKVRELVAAGMSEVDARRVAAETFGDLSAIERELLTVRHDRTRRRRRREILFDAARDLAFAWRSLRLTPGFTISALLTLALAIGATTALFGVVNGVLLRPLPYPNAPRVISVWTSALLNDNLNPELPFSAANFLDLRERARSLDDLAALRTWSAVIGEGDAPALAPGARVTGGFFGVLGIVPAAGRLIADSDDRPQAPRVVVIGHDLWRRRFGGDSGVIGSQVTLSGDRFTVIGIAPPGFRFPRGAELPQGLQFPPLTDFWVPMAFTAEEERRRGTFNVAVIGLRDAGTSIVAAGRELSTLMRSIGDENGMATLRLGATVRPLLDQAVSEVRAGLLLLFGAVTLVLLVAAANVVNLLLARTARRQRELAIRTALGAGRGRIVRQLVTENLLLSLAGGGLGIVLAWWSTRFLVAMIPPSLPRLSDVVFDATVAGFALLVSLGVGAGLGVAAGRFATRANGAAVLRTHTRSASAGARSRRALVIAEVALSLILLAGGAALLRSLVGLYRVEPGFDARDVITSQLLIPFSGGQSFAEAGPGWVRVFEEYLDRVRALPGVRAAGGVSSLPLSGAWESTSFSIDGRPERPVGERPEALYAVVTPGYLEAMDIPLRAGRGIADTDRATTTPVVVVSEDLAERHWPGESAIGKRLRVFTPTPAEIVGVVGDVRQTSLLDAARPSIYFPLTQMPYPFQSIVVESDLGAGALAPALRRELAAVNRSLPLERVEPMREVLEASVAQRRFGMLLVAFFAVAALALALLGLYGVIAYSVSQRTHEIGVRMALGASRRAIFAMVLGEGARLVLVGAALGIAGAVGLSFVLGRFVEGVTMEAPVVAGLALLLGVTAIVATGVPARRATRVDPNTALRTD